MTQMLRPYEVMWHQGEGDEPSGFIILARDAEGQMHWPIGQDEPFATRKDAEAASWRLRCGPLGPELTD